MCGFNRKMKRSITFFALALFFTATAAVAQTPNFKIKGVGLDSSEAAIKRALGQPASRKLKRLVDDGCTDYQATVSLVYSGISFELYGGANGRDARVRSFEITGATHMKAMGFPIGSSEKQVQAKFRTKLPADTIEGSRVLTYTIDEDGVYANFYFRRGKLVRISIDTMFC